MIYSDSTPITYKNPLPASVDVVIIGAGVIGMCTAWYLARQGVSVFVCDKGRVAGEQSSRNWGWVRQQGRDPDELPIMIESINSWETIASELEEDIGFARRGILYAAETETELAEHEKWLDTAQQHQLDTRMLTADEVNNLIKDKPGQWVGGIYTPSDGKAEPFKAVPAIAKTLHKRGVPIRESCAVRSLDIQAGRVCGVVTEHGVIAAPSVVCAAGAWSTLFFANQNISLPQLSVRATVARTADALNLFEGCATLKDVAIRSRQDGGYTIAASNCNEHFINADSFRYLFSFLPALANSAKFIKVRASKDIVQQLLPTRHWGNDEVSPFELNRVLNPDPSRKALQLMHAGLAKRLPQLTDIPFVEAWAGMIDVTPDVVPVMDQIEKIPGLYLATGFSGHGFGIGPGAGRVMADLVLGNKSAHDLTRFRFSRFSDGSKLIPGPGL